MNSITRAQLTALLLICDIFSLICFKGSLSVWMMAGYAVGTVIQLILVLPLISVKMPKRLSMVYLILFGGVLMKRLWSAIDATFIPSEFSSGIGGKMLVSGLIAVVCLYISSTGMKAAARSAVAGAAVGSVFLLIDLASAVFSDKFSNITASADCGTFPDGLLLSLTASGLPVALLVLLPLVKNGGISAVLQYYSLRLLICTAVILTALLVAGGIMETAEFPVITAAQLSQPFAVQRIDPLFLMLFVIFGVFALTTQVMTAAYLFGEVCTERKKWRSTIMIALIILGAAAMSGCSSTGLVHDKLYLQCVGIDGNSVTMTFFGDETVTVESEDIPTAKDMAELRTGKPIVTGFTEIIVLGDCDKTAVLEYMLNEWKVSPSCMAVESGEPREVLTGSECEELRGRIKEAVKKGVMAECGIVEVLERELKK